MADALIVYGCSRSMNCATFAQLSSTHEICKARFTLGLLQAADHRAGSVISFLRRDSCYSCHIEVSFTSYKPTVLLVIASSPPHRRLRNFLMAKVRANVVSVAN